MELQILKLGSGRMTLGIPGGEADEAMLRRIFEIPGVTCIVYNKRVRKLLIQHSPQALPPGRLLEEMAARLPGARFSRVRRPASEAHSGFDFDRHGHLVYSGLVRANQLVHRATRGFGPGGALASTLMAGLSVFEFLRRPLPPRWCDIAYYAASFQLMSMSEARERALDGRRSSQAR